MSVVCLTCVAAKLGCCGLMAGGCPLTVGPKAPTGCETRSTAHPPSLGLQRLRTPRQRPVFGVLEKHGEHICAQDARTLGEQEHLRFAYICGHQRGGFKHAKWLGWVTSSVTWSWNRTPWGKKRACWPMDTCSQWGNVWLAGGGDGGKMREGST
jgi:hypothetical protein